VPSVPDLIGAALRLDPNAFEAMVVRPDGARLALAILIAAGLSHALGQSVVLFAHRVRPGRFALSLAVAAVLFAASVAVWGAALELVGRFAVGGGPRLRDVLVVIGLAHAPRLLGLLTLTPYFGSGFGTVLTVWTLLASAVGAQTIFDFSLAEALVALGAAWLVSEAVGRTIGRPLMLLARNLTRWAEGQSSTVGGGAG